MPVRRVSNHGKNIMGRFPSIKMGRMIGYESTIERDLIYILDFVPHVAAFVEQPVEIPYRKNNRKRKYTPDFKVDFTSGQSSLIECKPAALVSHEKNREKILIGEAWAKEQGWGFEVITDEMLRQGCYLRNVVFLTQFAHHNFSPSLKYNILSFVDAQAQDPILLDIVQAVCPGEPSLGQAAIFYLTFHHDLILPIKEKFLDFYSSSLIVKRSRAEESGNGQSKFFHWH